MENHSAFGRKFGASIPHDMGTRVVDFVRSMHPQKTALCVSAETGISAKTVAKWLERVSSPGGLAVLQLTAAYGPEFLVAVFPTAPAWLSAAHRAERAAQIERRLASLQAERDAL